MAACRSIAHWQPTLLLLLPLLLLLGVSVRGRVEVEAGRVAIQGEEELEQGDGGRGEVQGGRLRAPGGSASVLGALLDSDHQLMLEWLDKAGMLQPLESRVAEDTLTILSPNLDKCDPGFRRWLLQPANILHLQKLLQHHVVVGDIPASQWRDSTVMPLSEEAVTLEARRGRGEARLLYADHVRVVEPDAIVREDGRVHRLEDVIVPRTVRKAYALFKRYGPPAPSPADGPPPGFLHPLLLPDAPAPAPGLVPAYAPAPGPSAGIFRGTVEEEVANFVEVVASFGGYWEIADLIANLTSLSAELTLLLEAGHRFTLLAPDDLALGKLTSEQISVAEDIENILWYHVIPDYLTEEDIYNAVSKASTQVVYPTLRRGPGGTVYGLAATEAHGTVEFGEGRHTAIVYDNLIFADGRISVIGINAVLFPPGTVNETAAAPSPSSRRRLSHALHPQFSILSQPNAGLPLLPRLWMLLLMLLASCLLGA